MSLWIECRLVFVKQHDDVVHGSHASGRYAVRPMRFCCGRDARLPCLCSDSMQRWLEVHGAVLSSPGYRPCAVTSIHFDQCLLWLGSEKRSQKLSLLAVGGQVERATQARMKE